MFPPGYKVLPPPAGYVPIRTPSRKLTATPTPNCPPLPFLLSLPDRCTTERIRMRHSLKKLVRWGS